MESNNFLEKLDPRIKLLIVIVFVSSAYFLPNSKALLYLYCLMATLFFLRGMFLFGIKILLAYGIFELLKYLITLIPITSVIAPIAYMMFFLQRTLSAFIMISWMGKNLNISKLIASFQKMRLPVTIILSASVIFRFFPTVKDEFSAIKNTMKLRNIGINRFFLHPIKTVEYCYVPLFIRSMKIADEISICAITRGLSLNKQRSSFVLVKLTLKDYLIGIGIILALLPGFYIFN